MPALPVKLDYASSAEETDFFIEVNKLNPDRYFSGDRLAHLLVVYRRLVAELSPFAQQLREAAVTNRPPLLTGWLQEWVSDHADNEGLFDVLLYLGARGMEPQVLQELWSFPDFLQTTDELGLLRAAPMQAIRQWCSLVAAGIGTLGEDKTTIAYRLILETFFHDAGQFGENEELMAFLQECYDPLLEKFLGIQPKQEVLHFADWFQLWVAHYRQEVPNLPEDHAYYALDFPTIIKYLPPVILWNNGIPYLDRAKAFHYYSEEYFWLATGGSLRKLPNHPAYSKRMAKEFLSLPRQLETGEADVYVLCFLRSLEVPTGMAIALERFFRRPADIEEVKEWKARLDPVVQKLREANYNWAAGEGDRLLQYLHRAVRDQFGFAINVRPIEQLEREAEAYYQRIAERRTEAERRQAEREATRRAQKEEDAWRPLQGVAPWVEEGDAYSPVRRWKIVELTHRSQLEAESAQMRHCVSTYFQKCRNHQASIWSMRELRQNGTWYSLVTIEIIPKQRKIVQLSARLNAPPRENLLDRIRDWAHREQLIMKPYH